jgi:hypothetical protein
LLRMVRTADPFKMGQVRELRLQQGRAGYELVCTGLCNEFVEEANVEEIRRSFAEVFGHPITLVSS